MLTVAGGIVLGFFAIVMIVAVITKIRDYIEFNGFVDFLQLVGAFCFLLIFGSVLLFAAYRMVVRVFGAP